MNRAFFLPLLSIAFLAEGVVRLNAEEPSSSPKNLTFEQIDGFRTERKYTDIIAALQPEDLTGKAGDLGQDVDSLYSLRAQAHAALKEGEAAEADYKRALAASPDDGRTTTYLFSQAENYRSNLKDPAAALSTYQKTIDLCFQRKYTTGWLPIQATISASEILRSEGKYDEALVQLKPFDELMERIPPIWKIKLLRAYAEAYLGQGQEESAKACYEKISQLEALPGGTP